MLFSMQLPQVVRKFSIPYTYELSIFEMSAQTLGTQMIIVMAHNPGSMLNDLNNILAT